MTSREQHVVHPADTPQDSITTEWDKTKESARYFERYGLLSVASFVCMVISRRFDFLGYLDESVWAFGFTVFGTMAANVAVHWGFEPKYQLDRDGVTVKRRCWFTRSIRWRDVERVRVYDPEGSFWQMLAVEKFTLQLYGPAKLPWRRTVAIDVTKFENPAALREFVNAQLTKTLQNSLDVQWALPVG